MSRNNKAELCRSNFVVAFMFCCERFVWAYNRILRKFIGHFMTTKSGKVEKCNKRLLGKVYEYPLKEYMEGMKCVLPGFSQA